MKKLLIGLTLMSALSAFADVEPRGSMPLKPGQEVMFQYKEAYTRKGVISISGGYYIKYSDEFKVKSSTDNFTEICSEKLCKEVYTQILFSKEKGRKVLLENGKTFQVGDIVEFTDGSAEIIAISVKPDYRESGIFGLGPKFIDRTAVLKMRETGDLHFRYLSIF